MNTRLVFFSALLLSSCTERVEVSGLKAGDDYSGLTEYEKQEFEWAAIEVDVPPEAARLLRRWELNNVSLNLSRCEEPNSYYPADARRAGTFFTTNSLDEQPAQPITLIFYVPKDVQQRERFGCAILDARGYAPVFLNSQMLRLPPMRFESLRAEQSQ